MWGSRCRTCGANGADVPLWSGESSVGGCPAAMLSVVTPLRPSPKDRLPRLVCNRCLRHLRNAYAFNLSAVRSHKSLLTHLEGKKSDTPSETPQTSENTNADRSSKKFRILPKVIEDTTDPMFLIDNTNVNLMALPETYIVPDFVAPNNVLADKKHSVHLCKKCGRKYVSAECLRIHMEQSHLEVDPVKTCSTCSINFDSLEALTRHNLELHFPSTDPAWKPTCNLCKKVYKNKHLLARHKKKVHSGRNESTHTCEECKRAFNTPAELNAHKITCDSSKTVINELSCKLCKLKYKTQDELTNHEESHTARVCDYCNRSFYNDESLTCHSIEHENKENPFVCILCNKMFAVKQFLQKHLQLKHALIDEPFSCGHCSEFQSSSIERLEQHLGSHESETAFVLQTPAEHSYLAINGTESQDKTVDECSAITGKGEYIIVNYMDSPDIYKPVEIDDILLKTQTDSITDVIDDEKINLHYDVAHEVIDKIDNLSMFEGNSLLNISDKSEVNTETLKNDDLDKTIFPNRSKSKAKLTDQASLQCRVCSKTFQRLYNLQKHLSVHKNKSNYCAGCGFESTDEPAFDEHLKQCQSLRSSSTDRICFKCGKILTTAAGLRYHLKTHSGVRQFACKLCQRRFLTMANLKAHIRTVHLRLRNYLCNLCTRSFSTLDHLRKHNATAHISRRDHVCFSCGQRFLQSSHLTQHMLVHTGDKPHHCPYCSNKYMAKCSLSKHLRKNHLCEQALKEEKLAAEAQDNDLIFEPQFNADTDNGIIIMDDDFSDSMNVVIVVNESTQDF